ncbi:MAG: protocatechuate 3,4-dioxygenase [Planctomycetota bacterium]
MKGYRVENVLPRGHRQRPAYMRSLRICTLLLLASGGCGISGTEAPPLEWTGSQDAPEELSWSTVLAGLTEPGEPLVMRGCILNQDGKPASGVLLYVYHTNAEGVYPRAGGERGNGRRHDHLRGWMRSDAQGRYLFRTIRPGPYPGRDSPAHIHATVTRQGGRERWVDSYWFAGDPYIAREQLARREGRGGPGAIVAPSRDSDGVWQGRRDIRLADWPWRPGER